MTLDPLPQPWAEDLEASPASYGSLILDRAALVERLAALGRCPDLTTLREEVRLLSAELLPAEEPADPLPAAEQPSQPSAPGAEVICLRRDVLGAELDQIVESQTLDRAAYYLRRLLNGVQRIKTNTINDINLLRWKEYDEIITDSLWLEQRRDTSGEHLGWYWGNFIPQIPRQLLLRYTRRGDWVLDTFLGSGTTLIECRLQGRNGIGIELNPEVAVRARETLERAPNVDQVVTEVVAGDNRTVDLRPTLERLGVSKLQLVLMHPPYHDIIKFSDDERDLSVAPDTESFLRMFGQSVDNVTPHLERGRYLAVVIGDKYARGEWIPLGFYCMQEVLKRDYALKSIVVKNFEETRGKRSQKELWRYRALVGGFYVFKHEYIFLFKRR